MHGCMLGYTHTLVSFCARHAAIHAPVLARWGSSSQSPPKGQRTIQDTTEVASSTVRKTQEQRRVSQLCPWCAIEDQLPLWLWRQNQQQQQQQQEEEASCRSITARAFPGHAEGRRREGRQETRQGRQGFAARDNREFPERTAVERTWSHHPTPCLQIGENPPYPKSLTP